MNPTISYFCFSNVCVKLITFPMGVLFASLELIYFLSCFFLFWFWRPFFPVFA
ncbi:hypothetical protein Lalb_Chr02g0140751 [Lupinus albus]|uniref:Uncharacterized protein n=1 Tax=Lupinus albus TaxID=3870 RepID=A0A6A4QVV7_LUPAL|nr:hypothetical protein Lalb_Chr02g0140751 [Lupinus albus]